LNYRLLFFKDSVAACWLDETTGITIDTVVHDNYQVILGYIFVDVNAPVQILKYMKPETSLEMKLQTVRFVLDICNASKLITTDAKNEFFVAFLQKGFLKYLYEFYKIPFSTNHLSENELSETTKNGSSDSLVNTNEVELLQVLASELLVKILQTIPQKFKRAIISESKKLLSILLDIMILSKIDSPKFEIIEFYKCLLNPEADYLKNDILDLFYEECIPLLVEYLKRNKMKVSSLYFVLDLLTYCVNEHNYRGKYFVLQYNVLEYIEPLYTHRVKYIRMAALKLLRAVIGLNDVGVYNRIVVKDSFRSVIEMVEKIRGENLIKSIVLEIFCYIAKKSIEILTKYLIEHFPQFIKNGCFSRYMPMKELRVNYELHRNSRLEDNKKVQKDILQKEMRMEYFITVKHRDEELEKEEVGNKEVDDSTIRNDEDKEIEKRRHELRNKVQEQRREKEKEEKETKLSKKRVFPEDHSEEEQDNKEWKDKSIQILFPNKL
jgi:protein phosphatase-4 regulatory subunit 3